MVVLWKGGFWYSLQSFYRLYGWLNWWFFCCENGYRGCGLEKKRLIGSIGVSESFFNKNGVLRGCVVVLIMNRAVVVILLKIKKK